MADPGYAHVVIEGVRFEFSLGLDQIRNRSTGLISPDQRRIKNELRKDQLRGRFTHPDQLPVPESVTVRLPPVLES